MKLKHLLVTVFSVLLISSMTLPALALTSVGNEDALTNAIDKGGDIKLSKSIILSSGLVIGEGKTVSLDLNGKTLDRRLAVCREDGSVITVMPGGKLTIRDTSGTNAGIIKGGASFNGGGICNYGDLTIEAGTIIDNKATDNTYGCGGGIFNGKHGESTATLTVKGGVIKHNNSRNGSGVYNDFGCTLNIEEGSYIKTIGNIKKTIIDNVNVVENSASTYGGGIYNAGTLNMSGSPVFSSNNASDKNCDIYLSYGKYITLSGVLSNQTKIIVKGEGENPILVKDYKKYNTVSPQELFKCADNESVVMLDINNNAIMKNTSATVVQLFSGDTMTYSGEYDAPGTAWDFACRSSITGNNHAEITLGSNWSHDNNLTINENSNIVLDLNGHYVLRTRDTDKTDDGEVFYVKKNAAFTVKDSNPESRGYDGLSGGVIAGGASSNGGGGIHIKSDAVFSMYGGTIYKCYSDKHGGGLYVEEDAAVNMKDCTVYFCQTVDSTNSCHGGAIYFDGGDCDINLENVIFKDCYSEDSGGALYLADKASELNVDIKNCTFIGNSAEDDGGAISLKCDGEKYNVRIDSCAFRNNRAGGAGGAIRFAGYDSSKDQPPILVKKTSFYENYSGGDGSAVFITHPGIVLYDCIIEENESDDSGAVNVNEDHVVSLAGKTRIINNTADEDGDNLNLESNATFESAGLCDGSSIYFFCSRKNSVVSKHISQYQTRFFHPEEGNIAFTGESSVDTPFETASLFGNGSLIIMITMGIVAVAAAVIAIIYKKKKRGAFNDDYKN